MCLGVPARVVAVDAESQEAVVETGGFQMRISLALVEGCSLGCYVLVHAGYAISVIDSREGEARLKLWQELITRENSFCGQ